MGKKNKFGKDLGHIYLHWRQLIQEHGPSFTMDELERLCIIGRQMEDIYRETKDYKDSYVRGCAQ